MAIRTYLQGSLVATAAATVRFTHTNSATTSDWTIAAGDYWASVDALVSAANVAIVSGSIGGSKVRLAVVHDTSAHTGTIDVDTDGSTFSVAWSQSGDGSAIRDFLGEVGDLTTEADGYDFDLPHKAGWYPSLAAQQIRTVGERRPRAQMQTLSGASRTQSNPATADGDEMEIGCELWCSNGSGAQEGLEQLETFVDELHSSSGEPFSVFHGESGSEDQWVCRFAEGDIEIRPRRAGRGNLVWAVSLRLIGEVVPW